MEIYFRNYPDNEKNIIENIKNCDFISFDLEMTGIDNEKNNNIIDTPQRRYEKYKLTAETYSIIQFGLSLFKYIQEKNIFECYIYYIYMFPYLDNNNKQMILELKSMLFNNKHNIDYNKWFDGAHYLNNRQYLEMKKDIIDNNINISEQDVILNGIIYNKCENIIKDIKENFITNENSNDYIVEDLPLYMLYYIKNRLKDNNLYFDKIKIHGNIFTLLSKYDSKEKKEQLLKKDIEKQLYKLERKKGVKNIYDAIIQYKKRLIGHNNSLDILFIISHLGEKLPDDYQEFKGLIHRTFPNGFYDTKLIFEDLKKNTILNLKDKMSTLEIIYPILSNIIPNDKKVNINVINYKMDDNNNNIQYHNAGIDSYITGIIYIYLRIIYNNYEEFDKKFKNKIFMMKNLYKYFDFDYDEEYLYLNCEYYVLQATRKCSDIILNNILGAYRNKIVDVFNFEKKNFIVLVAKFSNNCYEEEKIIFENILNHHKNHLKLYKCFTLENYRQKYL